MRGIQYAAAFRFYHWHLGNTGSPPSLSSGGATRRPGGGRRRLEVWRSRPETVIASEATQSILPRKERMDCFVASLPCANASRLSQATTTPVLPHKAVIPRACGVPSTPQLFDFITGISEYWIVPTGDCSCVALATLKIRGVMSDNFCGSFRVRHIRQAPARKSPWEDQMTTNLAAPRACTAIATVILCSTTALPTIATAADRGLGTDEAAACAAMSSAGTGLPPGSTQPR